MHGGGQLPDEKDLTEARSVTGMHLVQLDRPT